MAARGRRAGQRLGSALREAPLSPGARNSRDVQARTHVVELAQSFLPTSLASDLLSYTPPAMGGTSVKNPGFASKDRNQPFSEPFASVLVEVEEAGESSAKQMA
jgi:hypothetical protein